MSKKPFKRSYKDFPTVYELFEKQINAVKPQRFLFNDLIEYFCLVDSMNSNKNEVATVYPNLINFLYNKIIGSSQDRTSVFMDGEFLSRYGDRKISPYWYNEILNYDIDQNTGEMTATILTRPLDVGISRYLMRQFFIQYGRKWEDIIKAFDLEYEPLHNYSMVEEENVNTELTVKDDNNQYTFGYNTATDSPKPTDKSSTQTKTTGDFDDNHRKLTRKGNIGVTTSQQMLESELKLREYRIINGIIEDLADFLTLKVYV